MERKRERREQEREREKETMWRRGERARESEKDGARCSLEEKDIGAMEPSNLLRCPRAPFNETRLMQRIDHLGMH